MKDEVRLERVTVRTYRIRTSRFAASAPKLDRRRVPSRFATGAQRRGEGGSPIDDRGQLARKPSLG